MTDFTHTIDTTGESIEDLQEDLEALLEDRLGFGVTITDASVANREEHGTELAVGVELDPLERELARSLDAEVHSGELRLYIVPASDDA